MQTITCAKIRELKPCYDPALRLPEDYSGSIVDFLKQEQIPAEDRIWVVRNFVSDRTNRLFAVWCARRALGLQDNPDPRSSAVCDTAERFARGEATREELSVAHTAAWSAYLAAAHTTAYSAARSAAAVAAHTAAWSAARSAAWSAWSEACSAWSEGLDSATKAQIQCFIKLIEQEEGASV